MPILEKIVVKDYKNIELQELEFSPNVNCISGNNGEGKTNLLDAIYYLSMTKSAFSSIEKFNFRYGTKAFSIAGTYKMPTDLVTRFSIQVSESGEKKLRKDDKTLQRVSEHIGTLPIVMVSPSDISLVSESGEERRKFVNSVLSQLDRNYLSEIQQYNRLLLQRNKHLKEGPVDGSLLDTFDARLAYFAAPIYKKRKIFVQQLMPVVQQYYEEVSGGCESVSIEYKSDLDKETLEQTLRAHRDRDIVLKYTSAGVQRDEFIFTMNGYPIRKCGSQGQQKSFLVSLKFAQYDIMRDTYGYAPTLLLDDLFDKLDTHRVSNLLQLVAGSDFGQIFLSDCNFERISGIVDAITAESAYFETSMGTFKKK